MTGSTLNQAVLAAVDYSWPAGPWEWGLYGGGLFLALLLVLWTYVRDTRELPVFWRTWLLFLRLAVVGVLVWIALDPHDKRTKRRYSPSQVALLVDTSASMAEREESTSTGTTSGGAGSQRSRAEAVAALLGDSSVIQELQKQHDVSVYTFDETLEGPHVVFPSKLRPDWQSFASASEEAAATPPLNQRLAENREGEAPAEPKLDWKDRIARAEGAETRLGHALLDLMREKQDKTLSGLVVISDGGFNAGENPDSAHKFALDNSIRVVTVGVGSTERPINLRVASMEAPTHVNKGESYEVTATLRGTGMAGMKGEAKLYVKPKGAEDAALQEVENGTQAFEFIADAPGGTPPLNKGGPGGVESPSGSERAAEPLPGPPLVRGGASGADRAAATETVKFQLKPQELGTFEYVVRARPLGTVDEFRTEDNESRRTVTIVERNLGVLIVAGGPMRDYRYVHTMLKRHPNMNVDIWLQTVEPRTARYVAQDADDLLLEFPTSFPTRPKVLAEPVPEDSKEARQYDVVIAFDPDWKSSGFGGDGLKKLNEWVARHSGGMLLVAGEVHTNELAGESQDLKPIRDIYPVVLDHMLHASLGDTRADTPHKPAFTREGSGAAFLTITEDDAASERLWNEEFEGVYRAYPTRGKKSGAVVYAYFDDPRVPEESRPVLIASQFYGSGKVVYLGSSEIWRLRAVDETYYDRFWINAIREVGQGRLGQRSSYGKVTPLKDRYVVGEMVQVEAQLVDLQNQDLAVRTVRIEVLDPNGMPLESPRALALDETRPGLYRGEFRASRTGTYTVRVTNPAVEQERPIVETVAVSAPNLELDNPEQNVALLTKLARDRDGREWYFPLAKFEGLFAELDKLRERGAETERNEPGGRSTAERETDEEPASAEKTLAAMFPYRGDETEVDERLRSLWDLDWILYLLVALLSVEWLTRKLLKLA